MKFFLLINVKMPTVVGILTTVVGILTFMSGKNSILGLSEPKKGRFFYIHILTSILKTSCSTELSMKKNITSGPGLVFVLSQGRLLLDV